MEVGAEIGAALAAACAAYLDDADGLGVDGGLAALDDRELAERLQQLERLHRRVEHAIVSVVAEVDRRGAWAVDGHRSVRGWCQATVNWSGAETTHRIRTVQLLSDLDGVADDPRRRRRRDRPSARAGTGASQPALR